MSENEGNTSLWHQLLEARISRRGALKGSFAAGAASLLPLNLQMTQADPNEASTKTTTGQAAANRRAPFRPIRPTTTDDLVLPRGYRYNVLRVWGDEIAPSQPFGYNADFIGYFPIDALEGGNSSSDGLLWVNHEYPNPLLMYGYTGGQKTADQVAIERMSVGGSVLRVQRQKNGQWTFVSDSHNRRVTGYTTCRLTGPAAGSAACRGRGLQALRDHYQKTRAPRHASRAGCGI